MRFLKKNDGLTLVELMVSIAIGTMIFAAATTVLLLGIRIHHHTTDSIMQQYTARTVISMLEGLAEEGSIEKIERKNNGSWIVRDGGGKELLSYDGVGQKIYTGIYPDAKPDDVDGIPILEKIVASYVILEGSVLTISIEEAEETYVSSVYCRIGGLEGGTNFNPSQNAGNIIGSQGDEDEENNDDEEDVLTPQQEFLLLLNSQVGIRGGMIDHSKEPGNQIKDESGNVIGADIQCGCKSQNFFSEWFLPNGYDATATENGWGPDTPWCACFVSWGLENSGLASPNENTKWFANVDSFMKYFKTRSTAKNCWHAVAPRDSTQYTPKPGDLIFFDMVGGTRDDPSHMGAVLSVDSEKGKVTTIEGNSADMVAIREYELSDPRILGYGDPWAAQ